jgi:transketolase
MNNKDFLKDKCRELRIRLVQLTHSTGDVGAHIGGSLSLVEVIITIYYNFLKLVKSNTNSPNRNRFILSKGHSAMALYCVLEQIGLLSKDEVDQFEKNGSALYAHAHRNLDKGLEFSGGSLGLGVPYAVGVALMCKREGYTNRVYCLVGDGECDEGLVWEALMSAANLNLNNLTIVVDKNGFQSDGNKLDVLNQLSLNDKFKSFGFDTFEIDGHDIEELCECFSNIPSDKPSAVIANTLKGKGISFMEGNGLWHHGRLDINQYNLAISELQ